MRRMILAAALFMFLALFGFGSAHADYSFSFVGTDSNGLGWDLTGVLQTTVINGQTYITGGNLQEAAGAAYAYSGTDFTVLGLSALPALHGVPGSGGADFIADNIFYPTSNPVFSGVGITLENSSGPTITSANNSPPPASGAPYVNIWADGPGQYQLLYDSPMDGSGNGYTTPTIEAIVNVAPVPIPGAFLLFGPGLLALAGIRRRVSK
jgi:hypothetical protein